MPSRRILETFVLALVAGALLAACGGSSGDDSDEAGQITAAISTSVTSSDPADCTRLETQRFLAQIHFIPGPAAVKACQQDAPDTRDDPDSVDVTNIEVDGSTATADVAFHGGGFDGSTLAVSLAKEGGQWKLDHIDDIPKFDLAGFEKAFTQRLGRDNHAAPQALDCVSKALNQAGPEPVKTALISGDTSQLLALIAPCLGSSNVQ